jgi:predicted aldo/keto reductase-like oxidoreductase
MQYRDFGRTDWKVSALGFGCMRLPTTDKKPMSARIDRKKATRMIRHAIDRGVNYVDTAYPYHGGKSENFLAGVLKDGYREKVKLATKSPVWLIKKGRDFDKYLDEQMKRLRTDHIDLYLFHALNGKNWKETVLKFGLLDRAEAALDDGRIGRLGFSFHDNFKAFKGIVDGYDGWSFCQIQYNYLDTVNQAGTKGLRYAASKGLAVVIMEPLLGGRLATPPKPVRKILDSSVTDRSPADFALQWIWNQPEVSVVLSGMSTFGQVRGNLVSADGSGVGSLRKGELRLIERLQKKYMELSPVPCTKCSYCMPCPNGVNIPVNFEVYIDGVVNNDLKGARRAYSRFMNEKARASSCIGCRKCERKCPQRILISEWMPKIDSILGDGKCA